MSCAMTSRPSSACLRSTPCHLFSLPIRHPHQVVHAPCASARSPLESLLSHRNVIHCTVLSILSPHPSSSFALLCVIMACMIAAVRQPIMCIIHCICASFASAAFTLQRAVTVSVKCEVSSSSHWSSRMHVRLSLHVCAEGCMASVSRNSAGRSILDRTEQRDIIRTL